MAKTTTHGIDEYKYMTGPQDRNMLAGWRNRLAIISVSVSVIFPLLGLYFALLTVAFHRKSRSSGVWIPIAAVSFAIVSFMAHLWILGLVVGS